MERRALLWLLGAAVLWGTTGTAQALGGAEGSPLSVGAVRLTIGAVGLLALGWRDLRHTPRRWLLVGAVAMAGYQVAFFAGVARAGVALGTVVAIGSAPIVAGIADWASRAEPPATRWWIATALAVTGVALIAGQPQEVDVGGVGLAVLAGVAYALATLASKYLVEAVPPTTAMAGMFGVAAILLSPLIPTADLGWLSEPSGVAAAIWLGLGATTIAYVAFARGLRFATVGQAATVGLAEPATATLLGVLVLSERPPAVAWLGVASVVAALAILAAAPVSAEGARTPRGRAPVLRRDRPGRGT
ncbi:MAG TPA: EamA family transporter [Acidimicrobiia bacterium]|jgi:DME family drug/metabolite transporter